MPEAANSQPTMTLVNYEAARRALALAATVDEVQEIRNRADAVRHYAEQARDPELMAHVTRIKLRAERRAGELMIEMAASGQRHGRGQTTEEQISSRNDISQHRESQRPTLAQLGVTPNQSSAWQRLATVPEPEFEARVTAIGEQAAERVASGRPPRPRRPRAPRRTQTEDSERGAARLRHMRDARRMAKRIIDAGYRALAHQLHPDRGGTAEDMRLLVSARDLLRMRG